eukprot:6896406-Prymnesium_polylepis.1
MAAVIVILLCLTLRAAAFLYQPLSGQIWDPSCFAAANGTYFCVFMYSARGNGVYTSGWLATSVDAVHWNDVGPIAHVEPVSGDQWWKGFVLQVRADPPLFVMNHGVYEHRTNDALRILTSSDLLNWTIVDTSRSDPRWYHASRWDHMYMSEAGDGSYIGFAVSSPLRVGPSDFASTWPGVQRSPDAIHWTATAPLNVTWGGVTPQPIEEGGFERLALTDGSGRSRFYLIGGGGAAGERSDYAMWAFSSDAIDGPYSPIASRFRLSGG